MCANMRSLKPSPSLTSFNSKTFCGNILKLPKSPRKEIGVGSEEILLNPLEHLYSAVEKMAWAALDEHLGGITNEK